MDIRLMDRLSVAVQNAVTNFCDAIAGNSDDPLDVFDARIRQPLYNDNFAGNRRMVAISPGICHDKITVFDCG